MINRSFLLVNSKGKLLLKEKTMREDLSSKKNSFDKNLQAETIKKLNETKQYTLLATALLEAVLTDSRLTPSASKLWKYLYSKAVMNEHLSVKIKYKDLAEKFSRTERSIKRYVENLKDNDYLHVESNFYCNGQRANTFYLKVPDHISKTLANSKDRKKDRLITKKTIHDPTIKNNGDKSTYGNLSLSDKNVTLNHDINVTPNNNIKKEILLNNNIVVSVVNHICEKNKSEKKASKKIEINPSSEVLHGTIDKDISNSIEGDQIKINQMEKTVSALYIKMGSCSGNQRKAIFDEIRKLQENISTMKILIDRRNQIIQLPSTTNSPSCTDKTVDFSQTVGDRKLSSSDITRIKNSVEKEVSQSHQVKICNEIFYAVRFGSLRISQSGQLLSIPHAINIALKLLREKRWETPTTQKRKKIDHRPIKTQNNYENRSYYGYLPIDGLLQYYK